MQKDDVIYRQQAIDALEKSRFPGSPYIDTGIQIALREIKALESAQPEPCEDAVSRQRLLSDLKELTAAWGKYPVMAEQIKGVETAIRYVETIPSVTPERKRGKWIEEDDGWDGVFWRCSECNESFYLVDGTPVDNEYHFCPNCGADMRGEQND
jgi:rubrerythrin